PEDEVLAFDVVARAPSREKDHLAAKLGTGFDHTGVGSTGGNVESDARPESDFGLRRCQNIRDDVDGGPPVRFQDYAAHTHSLGLRQPLKLGFPFSFLGRKLEVDMTVDVNGAFHHFVINRHRVGSSFPSGNAVIGGGLLSQVKTFVLAAPFTYLASLRFPMQHLLYFLPRPHGQGSLRPAWRTNVVASAARTIAMSFSVGSPASVNSANFAK